ncbi:hypothetical protein CCHR01_03262 [Colletotrichum chrysophilum]|uniref:Uncharacterized protein n=1 Tax=Colletotrichum chrysophilum TaxID=1836956 RepID=A0AAD9EJJ0_9PEZI|nr:hypothetical protein CCHR01_03262 [Colletotrichum chrysophilum]
MGGSSGVLEDGPSTEEGVPPFGRIKYGVNETQHEELWEFEIKRLTRAAETSDITHLQPNIEGDNGLRSWHTSDEDFAQLGRVADKILYSLWLFSYEDEAVLRDHGYPSPTPDRGPNMFWNFQQIEGDIPDIHLHSRSRSQWHEKANRPQTDEEFAERLAVNQLNVFERDQYCYIVDEVTSILAHIAWESSESPYWKMVVLACLTKISTKIKVLATQLPLAISKSMEAIGDLRSRTPKSRHGYRNFDHGYYDSYHGYRDSDYDSVPVERSWPAQPIVAHYSSVDNAEWPEDNH